MGTTDEPIEERNRDVWEIFRGMQYDKLKEMLLNAAEDCDKRGHTRAIGERFRSAADVCDTACQAP